MSLSKTSRRQERRDQIRRSEKINRLVTIGLITVGALFIVIAIILPQIKPIVDVVTVQSAERPNVDRNSMGDPNAPIQIMEFSDFQCPYCEKFFTDTEPLLVQYYISIGKVRLTYRPTGNWVSNNIARASNATPKTESQDAGLAAYCAADQGKFWEMHDALFANNRDVEDQGSFTGARLTKIAETINLDMKTWQSCYNSGKYKDEVQKGYDDATAANIGGTPYFILTYKVNGETKTKTIDGAQPFSTFQVELESILNEIGAR